MKIGGKVKSKGYKYLLSLPRGMSKWEECEENGFHDWNVDYYDDAYTVGVMFSCNHCGATAETNCELLVVEP